MERNPVSDCLPFHRCSVWEENQSFFPLQHKYAGSAMRKRHLRGLRALCGEVNLKKYGPAGYNVGIPYMVKISDLPFLQSKPSGEFGRPGTA